LAHSHGVSPSPARDVASALNQNCHCITLDEPRLEQALAEAGHAHGIAGLFASRPHLFSHTAVFVDRPTLATMESVVATMERVVALPAYQQLALADAHPHARTPCAARGAFMGFDFHLGDAGPQLIEINTNAGGGLLNTVLRRAQRACCEPVTRCFEVDDPSSPDFVAMFEEEWRSARGDRRLSTLAIVDDDPSAQFLYPEFVMFQRAAEARGYRALICDARALAVKDGQLTHAGQPIDLVYNRVTDFYLEQPEHAALAQAFAQDLAVVTPHPRAYALYADKFRLALLSDAQVLSELGVAPGDAELLLRHIPRTRVVSEAERATLWEQRDQLFFKPQSGYGGKATYRGAKITKRVFEQLFREAYVAQQLVQPSSRSLQVSDEVRALKLDVRNFAYSGHVQLVCARLYQGQTTNFRTEGGGFAPVYPV
jgi:hypothetical protein